MKPPTKAKSPSERVNENLKSCTAFSSVLNFIVQRIGQFYFSVIEINVASLQAECGYFTTGNIKTVYQASWISVFTVLACLNQVIWFSAVNDIEEYSVFKGVLIVICDFWCFFFFVLILCASSSSAASLTTDRSSSIEWNVCVSVLGVNQVSQG